MKTNPQHEPAKNAETCPRCGVEMDAPFHTCKQRPTPETDEIAKVGGVSIWEHARCLERERNEARAELAALREDNERPVPTRTLPTREARSKCPGC